MMITNVAGTERLQVSHGPQHALRVTSRGAALLRIPSLFLACS
jgi:hypothetical protein